MSVFKRDLQVIFMGSPRVWRADLTFPEKSKVHPPTPHLLVEGAEKSKVHPPPVGGSLGNLKPSKVHGGGVQVQRGGLYKVSK